MPACYAFYEVGPAFVGCDEYPKLLEVSADGILQCSLGQECCPNYHIHSDRKIVVEIKSPTPQENVAETIFYEIPNRYVPQVQSEMKAYGCLESWLLCSTAISASVIVVQFDEDLWKCLWDLTVQLYAPEKPNIPTKLHKSVKQLKLEVASSKNRTTKLLCEVPTVSNRKQQKNIPYSYPVAYALKGSCMNNSHLQYMVSKVRTELRKRNIPVLCETYDGQWHKHITENKLSMRLT